MRTDAALTVHSHLRMSGRWTVLGAGKRLPRAVAARSTDSQPFFAAALVS